MYDLNGKCLAHGANAKLVGKDLMGMKVPDGKPLIKILVAVAVGSGPDRPGSGWRVEGGGCRSSTLCHDRACADPST